VVPAPSQYLNKPDPVEYIKMYISSQEKSVAASYRKSGKIDFYYDYELIDSTECNPTPFLITLNIETYVSMELNSKYIFLKKNKDKLFDDEGEALDQVLEIDHEAAQRIGESVGIDRKLDANKWHFIIYDLIRNHARIYTAITLVNTNFFVAFNKVVVIYDVVRKEWKNHFFFAN
jgi:hypothetical protein